MRLGIFLIIWCGLLQRRLAEARSLNAINRCLSCKKKKRQVDRSRMVMPIRIHARVKRKRAFWENTNEKLKRVRSRRAGMLTM